MPAEIQSRILDFVVMGNTFHCHVPAETNLSPRPHGDEPDSGTMEALKQYQSFVRDKKQWLERPRHDTNIWSKYPGLLEEVRLVQQKKPVVKVAAPTQQRRFAMGANPGRLLFDCLAHLRDPIGKDKQVMQDEVSPTTKVTPHLEIRNMLFRKMLVVAPLEDIIDAILRSAKIVVKDDNDVFLLNNLLSAKQKSKLKTTHIEADFLRGWVKRTEMMRHC